MNVMIKKHGLTPSELAHRVAHVQRVAGRSGRIISCETWGKSNSDARVMGFFSVFDSFIAPESLATWELGEVEFERVRCFQKVGKYISAAMERVTELESE
ncbi:hypothetical protein [Croceicoccus sp. YJ47]|uniref:hypothetical protein n=1 Tax=Croceicoccus sp. YJ47 TaxID=2798724 RepID=UPI001920B68D|nr:hypothetical protein [Croceicoccus sp. YJ47]QQN75033.1 hypothetical protein JD971_04875 [Croceicoccus sp. YJ47]